MVVADAAGRDEDAALALYRELRKNGEASVEELRVSAGLDVARAAAGWAWLERLGLVRAKDGGPAKPVEPHAAILGAMESYRTAATEHERSAREMQRVLDSLMTVYEPAVAQDDAVGVAVRFLGGDAHKKQMMIDLNESMRISCDSLHPGPMPPMEILNSSLERDRTMLARGVRVRAIYPRSILHTPRYLRYLQDMTALGAEVRLIDHAPYDLLVFDRHTALLAADPEDPSHSLAVVVGAVLVKSYIALFEDFWLRAARFDAPQPTAGGHLPEVTAQERAVIRLMADGLSDDQIARKLSVHRRTVQRAISKLMERLDATSRFEAGLKLACDAEFAALLSGA
ncbi:helix-turn-helix transcriptional regulator [Actinacidiphila bryophytorum]|uniref:Regulatory protein, luxR family n=1 Tax=Actinacidiphila bryophytorum TaxID=1436133 RepID=A0A9W4E5F0_9ACTN|nr:helix-turn-helix transcriptional regulator [Actinacidiphila bryophytorum]MBM9438859.1 helix-turn-helix transcriptional regulator [Actinacidiphila bryophytorum]MBN6542943.1 helix-turn-helix transcriptional regulator [Actinacidiphila bryophytorum]CAG7615459.1 Regulatory protein, luxR family [Actinacidiphila bryophytorum]